MTSGRDHRSQAIDNLRKIVAAEANDGFRDRMVHGGLDGFLANLRLHVRDVPALKNIQR